MKKFYWTLMVFTLLNCSIKAQNPYFDFSKRSEAYFSFYTDNSSVLKQLSRIISIDNVDDKGIITAYANEQEFSKFLEFNIEPQILTAPSMLEEYKMYDVNSDNIFDWNWDEYPSYGAYIAMMESFAYNFPDLCELIQIGTTVQGRSLLICKITSNVNINKKAEVLYTSTMHGDEVTGYVLMLRLIDYLLSNYNINPRITNILDNAEIWISPNTNPDGTYHGGNNTVYGATRYNANNVDLNRNYKDDVYGDHPDGKAWQPETVAFMDFQSQHNFHISINIHGGAEVCNYPWDNKNVLSADENWWVYVCREYADTVHVYNPSYMTYLNNGITRGYLWYMTTGSRQDYTNYYEHCREVTLEISNSKTPSPSTLPNYWNWNYRSLLNYMEQALYGVQGTCTDGITGLPIACSVTIEGHDHTNSHVHSKPSTGYYVRPIKAGTYTITYTALGYESEIRTVTVTDKHQTVQDVQFGNFTGITPNFSASNTNINLHSIVTFTDETFSINPITSYQWTFEGGTPSSSTEKDPVIQYNELGIFGVSLTVSDGTISKTISKENYIAVTTQYIITNGSVQLCNANFLDSGGAEGNYSDNENYTFTILPATNNAKIKITFTDFDVEEQASCNYDYLKIYDGNSTSYPLLGTFCGTALPGPFTSTADDGSITFYFHSDGSETGRGWQSIVECIPNVIAPIADFLADNTNIAENDNIQFYDLSENNPTQWLWVFDGGTPETSAEQNPTVTYTKAGNFGVSLTVSNEAGESTIVKENYISVALGISNMYENIKIYPNPAHDYINIVNTNDIISSIIISDITGNILKNIKVNNSSAIVDVKNVTAGLYFISIQNQKSTNISKILIK